MRRLLRAADRAIASFCCVTWPLPAAPVSVDEARVELLTRHLERKA